MHAHACVRWSAHMYVHDMVLYPSAPWLLRACHAYSTRVATLLTGMPAHMRMHYERGWFVCSWRLGMCVCESEWEIPEPGFQPKPSVHIARIIAHVDTCV